MGLLSDLFVRIKGDNKDLKSKLDESGKDVEKFGGKMKGLASAGGAVATAFLAVIAVWGAWAKNQVWGLDAVNKAMSVTKQLLNDIFSQQQINFSQYIENANEQNRIRNEDRKDEVWMAKLRRDIRQERIAARETPFLKEQIEHVTKALEKQRELEAFIKADIQEKLDLTEKLIDEGNVDITILEQRKQLRIDLLNADESESLRILSERNRLLAEEKKRTEDLVDAYTELRITAAGYAITNNLSPSVSATPIDKQAVGITANFAKGKRAGLQGTNIDPAAIIKAQGNASAVAEQEVIDEMTSILQDGVMGIGEMAGAMAEALGAALTGGNVKDIGKGLLMSFADFISNFGKMLVAFGIAQSAFYTALTAPGGIGAGAAIAAGLALMVAAGAVKGVLSRGTSGGGGGGGGGGGQALSPQQMKVIVEGRIKGKDIVIASRRYEESQG